MRFNGEIMLDFGNIVKPLGRQLCKNDGTFQSILSSSHIHVLENGSLTITVTQKSDAGYYMCETSNDVGEPLRYSVRLAVHSAPQIQTSTQVVHVRKSEEARFSCSASGDPPLNIVWSREGFPLSLYPENRYLTRESEGRGVKISEVVIKSLKGKIQMFSLVRLQTHLEKIKLLFDWLFKRFHCGNRDPKCGALLLGNSKSWTRSFNSC
ncbi:down syndrome cell adhesion molecule [Trichonephila inaurata madagascariensis]|uniref:Down syndrome cell adhesion molecule n=1 Tax=Trichonephila inaurata madagascariensis TaxID=2747483 RepID=A0A8X6XUJ7_9ARAC|nr:down syndrome cell adhesion molecule [Trichonephila inaurata madagascariensis]